jgi:L-2-hydroxyglutarate oxidase LhgO
VVVGGGIVGLASARALRTADPRRRVVVLEREQAVGQHQSSHNSGVLHAGVYYAPGSQKAKLCREGKITMEKYCAEHGIAVERNGKLVVALDRSELGRLDALVERARANGVEGVRVLDRDELREVEPHAAGIRALHSPGTAVVDFGAVCAALAAELDDVRTGVEVHEVTSEGHVETSAGSIDAKAVVVCAGLWSARLARSHEMLIVPFRGAWLALRPRAASLVRGSIYPVPDPDLPFLGVHITRRIDGSVWAGPNAVLSLAHPTMLARSLAFAGTWRLFAHHWRAGARELWRDRVRRAYVQEVARYLPGLTLDDIELGPRPFGVRAQAVARDGTLIDDFVFARDGRVLHVLNAPSPAATSALAIGTHIANEVR